MVRHCSPLLLCSLLLAGFTSGAKADCMSERRACSRATSELAQCSSGSLAGCRDLEERAQRACSNAEVVCRREREERGRNVQPRR